jgi:hypothetical protein
MHVGVIFCCSVMFVPVTDKGSISSSSL